MPQLFEALSENSFTENSKELQVAQLLNQGLEIINQFLQYKLGKEAEKTLAKIKNNNSNVPNDLSSERSKIEYIQIRNNLQQRQLALKAYLKNKEYAHLLKCDNPFAFFEAKDLVAIADMLEIVLATVQKEISVLNASLAKDSLNKKLNKLTKTRTAIIACMKAHINLVNDHSQKRIQEKDLEISLIEIKNPTEIPHSLITLPNLFADHSLSDPQLTEHPMRENFTDKNHPVFKPNEAFCLHYIAQYGSDDDKQWLKKTNRQLATDESWYQYYTKRIYNVLPETVINTATYTYDAAQPIVKTLFDKIYDWSNIIIRNSYVPELLKQLEPLVVTSATNLYNNVTSYVPAQPETLIKTSASMPELQRSTLNTSWLSVPHAHSESELDAIEASIQKNMDNNATTIDPLNNGWFNTQTGQDDHFNNPLFDAEAERIKKAATEATDKYKQYSSAFLQLNTSMTMYIHKIKNARGINAFTHSKDGIDFIKNFFCTRKTNAHEKLVKEIQDFMFSEDLNNFATKADQEKIALMQNIETEIRTKIEDTIHKIKKENNSFKSELSDILEDALTNQYFPWSEVDDTMENDDTPLLERPTSSF